MILCLLSRVLLWGINSSFGQISPLISFYQLPLLSEFDLEKYPLFKDLGKFHHSFHFISFHFYQSLTLKSTPFLRIWTSFTNPPLVLDSPLPYIQLGPNKYHYFGIRKMGYNGLKSVIIHQRHIGRYLKNGVLRSIAHVIKYANFQLYRVHPDGVIQKT